MVRTGFELTGLTPLLAFDLPCLDGVGRGYLCEDFHNDMVKALNRIKMRGTDFLKRAFYPQSNCSFVNVPLPLLRIVSRAGPKGSKRDIRGLCHIYRGVMMAKWPRGWRMTVIIKHEGSVLGAKGCLQILKILGKKRGLGAQVFPSKERYGLFRVRRV